MLLLACVYSYFRDFSTWKTQTFETFLQSCIASCFYTSYIYLKSACILAYSYPPLPPVATHQKDGIDSSQFANILKDSSKYGQHPGSHMSSPRVNPKDFFRSGIHGFWHSGSIVAFFGGYINLPKQRYGGSGIRTIRNCFVEDSEITMISISMQQKCLEQFDEVLFTQQKEHPESRNTVDGSEIRRSPVEEAVVNLPSFTTGCFTSKRWLARGFLNHQHLSPRSSKLLETPPCHSFSAFLRNRPHRYWTP